MATENYVQFLCWVPIKSHIQNGISTSYMDAVFKLVEHGELDLDRSITFFVREVYYSSQISSLCISEH